MRFLILAGALASATPDPGPPEHFTVERVLEQLDARNPSLADARSRADAERQRANAARSLPPPMLRVQTWNAPLERPWSASEAEMTMVGVEQTLPFPTRFLAAREAGDATADESREAAAATRALLQRDARVLFHEYWLATREVEAHRDHVELTRQVLAIAEARYASGSGRQHDVLRAQLAVSRQHAAVQSAGGRLVSTRAALAALLSVEPSAIAVPEIRPGVSPVPELATLESTRRPEVRAADDAVRAANARRHEASARAWLPDLTVGATWMDASMGADGGMVMVELELPWGWGGRRELARAARHEKEGAEAARRAVADGARAELRDAHARATAAHDVLELTLADIVPGAERTAEAVRSAWVTGNATLGDVLDTIEERLLATVEADRSRASLETALADLDRAAAIDPAAGPTTNSEGERR